MPIADIRGVKEMVRDLRAIREKALPFAARDALTQAAVTTRTIWQGLIRTSFVLRNQYTVRSILFERASGASVATMQSKVGSTTDYMDEQETGGTFKARKAIPAPSAAGQPAGSGSRTAQVRARFRLGAIHVDHPSLRGNRKQRNAIRMATAKRAGNKTVLLERPNGTKGLFSLAGGMRALKTRLLWTTGRPMVSLKGKHTLQHALTAVQPKLAHMYAASLLSQLNRLGIPHT